MTYLNLKHKNNASALQVWSISAGAVSVICATGYGELFPSTFPYYLTIENFVNATGLVSKREIVRVTARSSDTFTIVRSAGYCPASDTATTQTNTAFSFTPDADNTVTIKLKATAEDFDDLNTELQRIVATDIAGKVSKTGDNMTGLFKEAKGANIASATTTDLSAATGNEVHITGTTTIVGFGTVQAGTVMKLIFDGILTWTYNATSMILPKAGTNITTAAGDSAIVVSEWSGNWKCLSYQKLDGTALVSSTPGSATNVAEGIIRISTDPEVETGTLQTTVVNPYQLALYRSTPEQEIPYYVGSTATNSSNHPQTGSSATDNGVFFMAYFVGSTVTIFRMERQAWNGMYAITHTTTLNTTSTSVRPGLAVIGSYLYVCTYDATNNQMVNRYLAADLSGVTLMTLSGTNFGTVVGSAWTDGTYLYVYNGTTSQYNQYSISGTTYTFVATITYTTAGNASQGGAMSDGTSVWITANTSGAITIRKYAIAGGASSANKVVYIYPDTYPNNGRLGLFLSRKQSIGIAHAHSYESNSAMTGCVLRVKAIAVP